MGKKLGSGTKYVKSGKIKLILTIWLMLENSRSSADSARNLKRKEVKKKITKKKKSRNNLKNN